MGKFVIKNENGSILIITFAFILFFFVIVHGLLMNLTLLRQSTNTETHRVQLKYVLESATVILQQELKQDLNDEETFEYQLDGNSLTATMTDKTNLYKTFKVTAEKNDASGKLYKRYAYVTLSTADFHILDWKD